MQQHGKYYITLKGVHYEVSQEVQDAFYQAERQERYMAEKDQSHNLVILNILGMEELEEGRNQEYLASPQHGIPLRKGGRPAKHHAWPGPMPTTVFLRRKPMKDNLPVF